MSFRMRTMTKTRPQWERAYLASRNRSLKMDIKKSNKKSLFPCDFAEWQIEQNQKAEKIPFFWCDSCIYRIYDTCGMWSIGFGKKKNRCFLCDRVIDVRLIAIQWNTDKKVKTTIMQIVSFNGAIELWMSCFRLLSAQKNLWIITSLYDRSLVSLFFHYVYDSNSKRHSNNFSHHSPNCENVVSFSS